MFMCVKKKFNQIVQKSFVQNPNISLNRRGRLYSNQKMHYIFKSLVTLYNRDTHTNRDPHPGVRRL